MEGSEMASTRMVPRKPPTPWTPRASTASSTIWLNLMNRTAEKHKREPRQPANIAI